MATIIIFASSLITALALVLSKAIELRCGKKNFAMSCICQLDDKSDKLVSNLKFKTLQLIQSTRYIMLVQIKAVCKNLLHKVEERIAHEYKMKHTMIMGQKDISSNGSASFYLRKITEGKNNGEKGKIE